MEDAGNEREPKSTELHFSDFTFKHKTLGPVIMLILNVIVRIVETNSEHKHRVVFFRFDIKAKKF